MQAFKTLEQAYRAGVGVGRAAAEDTRIEFVCAVVLGLGEHLDESAGAVGVCDPRVSERAGQFSPDFAAGYHVGFASRCFDILERLNNDRGLRVGP